MRLYLILVVVALQLTATARTAIPDRPERADLEQTNLATVTPGVRFQRLEFAGTDFAVVTVDLRFARLEMAWRDANKQPLKTFSTLQSSLEARGERVLALMNAGIYDTDATPLGLHVQQGRVLHPLSLRRRGFGNFYLQPNGVFYIGSDGAHVTDTLTYSRLNPRTLEATQSGPLLVSNGRIHAAFQKGSENRLIRNGVGVESRSRVHLVLALEPVNFHDFARLMRDRLGCRNALYLDGNVSSLFVPGEIEMDGDFGPMIAVLSR